MAEIINLKLKAIFSIITLIGSWFFAQVPNGTSIIAEGFNENFSIGLLIVTVVVIWRAFNKKDESETALMREQIQVQKEHIEQLQKVIEKLESA